MIKWLRRLFTPAWKIQFDKDWEKIELLQSQIVNRLAYRNTTDPEVKEYLDRNLYKRGEVILGADDKIHISYPEDSK